MKLAELRTLQATSDANKDGLSELISDASTISIDLMGHIGKIIEVGNNFQTPLNEAKYTLKDFSFHKVLDGIVKTTYSLSLVLTVADKNGEEWSFIYPYCTSIKTELVGDNLKVYVTVRDRILEDFLEIHNDLTGSINEVYPKKLIDDLMDSYKEVTYRFTLMG